MVTAFRYLALRRISQIFAAPPSSSMLTPSANGTIVFPPYDEQGTLSAYFRRELIMSPKHYLQSHCHAAALQHDTIDTLHRKMPRLRGVWAETFGPIYIFSLFSLSYIHCLLGFLSLWFLLMSLTVRSPFVSPSKIAGTDIYSGHWSSLVGVSLYWELLHFTLAMISFLIISRRHYDISNARLVSLPSFKIPYTLR